MSASERIQWVTGQLIEAYGTPRVARIDPVENLVLTILSQNTTDTNRDRAFAALLREFGTLESIRGASVSRVADAIRVCGLHQQKSRAILAALDRTYDVHGMLDLSFLAEMPLEEAMSWLCAIPGVGPKTAGIVLLFSFHRPVFPADTHIQRVMRRVGIVAGRGDPHPRLNAILPPDWRQMQTLHLLAIRLGREVCRAAAPRCAVCPLHLRCDHATGLDRGGR